MPAVTVSDPLALPRIPEPDRAVEEAFLRKEVEAAGFKLAAEGNFLRNPDDQRDKNTPDPPMPKDEFFLKFVKP